MDEEINSVMESIVQISNADNETLESTIDEIKLPDPENVPITEDPPKAEQPATNIEQNDVIAEPEVATTSSPMNSKTTLNEPAMVATTSSMCDKTAKGLDLQRIKPKESSSTEVTEPAVIVNPVVITQSTKKSDDDETRVITLDTIIRKGLIEQMPMTAKDIDNIVPNAIKEKEKQEADKRRKMESVVIYSSDDDPSSEYDGSKDDNDEEEAETATNKEANVTIKNNGPGENPAEPTTKATINDDNKNIETASNTESIINNKNPKISNKSNNTEETVETRNINKTMPDESSLLKPMTEIPFIENDNNTNVREFVKSSEIKSKVDDDDETIKSGELCFTESDSTIESYGTSGNDSTNGSFRKNVTKKDDDKDFSIDDAMKLNTSGQAARKRGRPRKNYDDETEIKVQRQKLIESMATPKRRPGRPRREDGQTPGFTKFMAESNSNTITTPMDELMAMGHSLFSDYTRKKPGRPGKTENYEFDLTGDDNNYQPQTDDNIPPKDEIAAEEEDDDDDEHKMMQPIENMLLVQHNLAENNNPSTIMFKRKPGRPKIDRESGGHIVFQNSELTVVNKTNKMMNDDRQALSSQTNKESYDEQLIKNEHDNFKGLMSKGTPTKQDVEIVPIPTTSNRFMLPRETTIQPSGSGCNAQMIYNKNPYQDLTISNVTSDEHSYNDESMLIAPIDEMLEVHHIENYSPRVEQKRRGRKPKHEHFFNRNIYSDYNVTPDSTAMLQTPVGHKKRGRKPKSAYLNPNIDHAQMQNENLRLSTGNGPSISVKNINDLLEVQLRSSDTSPTDKTKRIRRPKIRDFPYEPPSSLRQNKQTFMAPAGALENEIEQSNEHTPKSDSILVGTPNKVTKSLRDKRLSGSKPTYAEWSESSSDNQDMDKNEQSMLKLKKPHWKTQQAMANKDFRMQWKTQLKLNQEQMLQSNNSSLLMPMDLESEMQQHHIYQTNIQQNNEQLCNRPDVSIMDMMSHRLMLPYASSSTTSNNHNVDNANLSSTGNVVENKVLQKVEEIPHTVDNAVSAQPTEFGRKKRIPKLKFGSFNFNERRDKFSNKPKMILKYKKKYKKKKPIAQAQNLVGSNIGGVMVHDVERKKPGPKPKLRIEAAGPVVKRKWVRKNLQQKGQIEMKRKYTRKEICAENADTNVQHEDSQTTGGDSDNRKRKIKEATSSGGTVSEIETNDMEERRARKKLKRKRHREAALQKLADDDPISNKLYLENYNQVLQDRNKVLLEILEQRSAEIRNLKLRVSNMTKTDDELNAAAEKKEIVKDDGSWTITELSKAYSLQRLSTPFYQYVQDRFALPLPAIQDVTTYINNINLTRGVLKSTFGILENDGETMNDLQRVTVLQISQIDLDPVYEYDSAMDTIIGPFKTMTVVVAKGLYAKWSQAVYINFDVTSFKQSLNLVIEELHKIKFSVVACACNFVDGKPNIWNELDVCVGCNYFSHPITTDFIYAFYYIDDIIVTIKDYFLKDGFTTDVGQDINKEPIEAVTNQHRIKGALHQAIVDSPENRNINMAMELFSKQTANLIRIGLPKVDANTNCADFIDVISSFYQLMNSKKSHTTISQSLAELPYGKNLEYQNNILNEIQLNFYKLRCPGTVKLSDFQRATMMSMESLKMLQHSTKQKYKIDSFPTHNITSEYLKKHCPNEYGNLSPLKAFGILKETFLKYTNLAATVPSDSTSNSSVSEMITKPETLFYEDTIDVSQTEAHYVNLLIQWIGEKYKERHPISVGPDNEEFLKKMQKYEHVFQQLQNPNFQIFEGVVTKVMQKFKSHTFGMFIDVLQTFVVQRHLLRIKYYNAVGINVASDKSSKITISTTNIQT